MMISDRPLHHQIWEREIVKLETFAECTVQFIGREHEFWRLFDKADLWKKIFECRIYHRFSVLCDHQVRYLSTLNKCLDIKLIRDFFRYIKVLDTFFEPLLGFLVETSFHEPYEHWADSAKLAFAIIYKIHTLDFEMILEENLGQLNALILEKEAMLAIWAPNRVHNEQKLSETLQIYWQLFCAPSQGLTEFEVKRSIVDCDDCLPLHDLSYVTIIRNSNMVLVWTLPANTHNEELLLTRMRPFIVNVCSPMLVDESLDTFIDFTALQARCCKHNLSRILLQDREIIRGWVQLVLTYRPDEFNSWSSAIQLLQAILRLDPGESAFQPRMGPIGLEHHWSLIVERISWFGEVYCELVQEDPRLALNVLIRGPRFLNIQCVVMLSAILLFNGTLTENDQLDIINIAVNQYNEIVHTRPALVEEYRFCLALLQLCLHKEACIRIMFTKVKDSTGMRLWFRPNFFADHILGYSAFRFLNYDTPRNIFQSAMYTVEVALLFKSKYRRGIKSKFESRLKEVMSVGCENSILAAIEFSEVERLKRIMRKRRRRQRNQRNSLWHMPPMTMAT